MFGTVSASSLYILTRQFSAMINGRLNLIVALGNLAKQSPRGQLHDVLHDVTEDVRAGADLADALAEHPKIFSRLYVSVVRSGLTSGRLADALSQLSDYMEQRDTVTRNVRTAMTYPIFVTVVFIGVFHMMTFVILPRFASIFGTLNKDLPAPTQFMMDLGDAYIANWPFIAAAVVIAVVSIVVWVSSEEGRTLLDEWKLRVPKFGTMWRLASYARFCRTFGVQLRYSIPAVEALRHSAEASGNAFLESSVQEIADRVENGSTLVDAFDGAETFGNVVVQMIATGEQAGTLDELMISAADYFDTMLIQELRTITSMINPLLTAIVGIAIAGMMIAAFLPVFELSGNV